MGARGFCGRDFWTEESEIDTLEGLERDVVSVLSMQQI